MHQTKTLAQCSNGYISTCHCCTNYNVSYKNSLFILNETELEEFTSVICHRKNFKPFSTTHGKEWILQSPFKNFFFVFTTQEIDELSAILSEATLLLEVQRIIQST